MKSDLVQVKNPRTKKYVLIDKTMGKILKHHPRKDTPYKDVEIKE